MSIRGSYSNPEPLTEIGPVSVARIRNEGKRNKRVTLVLANP